MFGLAISRKLLVVLIAGSLVANSLGIGSPPLLAAGPDAAGADVGDFGSPEVGIGPSAPDPAPAVEQALAMPPDGPLHLIPTPGLVAQAPAAEGEPTYDPTSIYDQRGVNSARGFSAQLPNEMVDPFSGNLMVRQTDLTLPGNAGLDLVIQRFYNSKIHRNYAAKLSDDLGRRANGLLFVPTSPLGMGWNMHLGRLVGATSALANNLLSGPRYYERSDGSQHPFFTYSGTGCGNGTSDVCLVTKALDAPYKPASGSWQMATADGRHITFDHAAFDGATVVYYATEIRDIHGNRIEITYHDETIPGIAAPNASFRHFIDYIRIVDRDSLLRQVDFEYGAVDSSGAVRLTAITANGRRFEYGYSRYNPWPQYSAFLTNATPPEGRAWQYEYGGLAGGTNGDCAQNSKRWCELTKITYPSGGTVEYNYDDLIFSAQTNLMAVRAVTQRVADDGVATPATWSYTYNRGLGYTGDEHTIVSLRAGGGQEIYRETYTYFGVGSGTYNPTGMAWKAGALLKKRVGAGSTVLQTETFDWVASPAISGETWGDPWIGFDLDVYVPRLREQTIERGSLRWTTTNTSFNESNHAPRCTTEQGDGATRYRLRTYQNLRFVDQNGEFHFPNLPEADWLSTTQFTSLCTSGGNLNWNPQDEFEYRSYTNKGQVDWQEVNGIRTSYQYDTYGRKTAELTYQGANQTNGFCTTYANYEYGVAQTIGYGATAPGCSGGIYTVRRTANWFGLTESETNGRNATTGFRYDDLGRTVAIHPPGEAEITIVYDSQNNLRRVTQDAFSHETRFDGFERKVRESTSAGVFVRLEYDTLGRIQFQSLPSDAGTAGNAGDTFTYDALGRIETVTRPDNKTVRYAYDAAIHTVRITDEENRTTVQTRRAFANPGDFQLIRVQLPDELPPTFDTYTYLVGGQLTGVRYPASSRTIAYTRAKLVKREDNPENGSIYYGYDAAGNLRCRSRIFNTCDDSKWDPATSLAEIRRTVDGLGRVTEIRYLAGITPTTFVYDNADNLVRMTDTAGRHDFEYTFTNRLSRRISVIAGVSYTTTYGYDSRGNLATLTYPSGRVVTYARDAGNRITNVRDATTLYASDIAYHPNGMAKSFTYGNGIATSLSLDDRQRPNLLGAANVLDLNYDYDGVGNVTSLSDGINASSTTFRYDDRDRLIAADGPWGALSYEYDAAGNRTREVLNGQSTTYTYDSQGHLTRLAGRVNLSLVYSEYGYGNVTRRGSFSYTYDRESRLTGVSGPLSASFGYDGQGQRMRVTLPGCGNDLVYLYDQQGNRIAESTVGGLIVKEYIVADRRTIAELDLRPLVVAPAEVDFGDVEVGTTQTRTVTLTNRTNEAQDVAGLSVGSSFLLPGGSSAAMPANGTTAVQVVFAPGARGPLESSLYVCQGGVGLTVGLRGRGLAAVAAFSATYFILSDVRLGAVVTRSLVASNTGDVPLRVASWTADHTALGASPAGAAVVQTGDAYTVTLRFDSGLACPGPFRGSFLLGSNGLGSRSVAIRANVRGLEMAAAEMEFDQVASGSVLTLDLGLSNQSVVPMAPTFALDGAPQFRVGALPAPSLAPGDSVSVPVTYRPTANLWSPFGDHATLRAGFQSCGTAASPPVHLSGNVSATAVAGAGHDPSLAIVTDTLHLASVVTVQTSPWSTRDALSYQVRDANGVWADGPDPTDGATANVNRPALLAGPGGRLTMLWDNGGNYVEMLMRQRVGGGNWGVMCTAAGGRSGWGPLASDAAGNTWLAWLDYPSYGLRAAPMFSPTGLCLEGQTPPISSTVVVMDLNLIAGPGGHLRLVGAGGAGYRDLVAARIYPLSSTLQLETPPASEVKFSAGPAQAVDGNGGVHAVWPQIQIGWTYSGNARYAYRSPAGAWGQPVVPLSGTTGADSMRVAVDSLGGIHIAWTDEAHAQEGLRKLYYATRPAGSKVWQVSDVTTPGYADAGDQLALVSDGDRLVAAWGVYATSGGAGELLVGETIAGAGAAGVVMTTTLTPNQGGVLQSPDGLTEVQFPTGAVSATTVLSYTPRVQPSESPGSFRFAGRSFTLEARDETGRAATAFSQTYTITLHYDDADWQQAGITDERTLNLYYWNGAAWAPVLPCAGCSLDIVNNRLVAVLDHLTEFALMGGAAPPPPAASVYLPIVLRGYTPSGW